MPNDLTKVSNTILAQGLMALRGMNVMPKLVNSDYDATAKQKNEVINVPIPAAIAATAVVPGATPPNTADVAPTSVPIRLDQWIEAPFYLTDKDQMQAMDGTIPMQASEAVKSIANAVNAYIFGLGKGFYGLVGTPGTTPFAGDILAASNARKALNKQLAPPGDRRIVLDMDAEGNAIVLPLFAQANTAGTDRTQVEGIIGRKVGFDWYADQQVPFFTASTITAGALTVAGVQAAGSKTLLLSKITTAMTLVKGDILNFAGSLQNYVVTADTAVGIGNTAVPIYPPLQAATAGGETVTLKASHVMNLAFQRDAIAFATRPLEQVSHPAVISSSASDPVSGLSMRLQITREHQRTRYSFDVLFGGEVVRPELGVRIAG